MLCLWWYVRVWNVADKLAVVPVLETRVSCASVVVGQLHSGKARMADSGGGHGDFVVPHRQ